MKYSMLPAMLYTIYGYVGEVCEALSEMAATIETPSVPTNNYDDKQADSE